MTKVVAFLSLSVLLASPRYAAAFSPSLNNGAKFRVPPQEQQRSRHVVFQADRTVAEPLSPTGTTATGKDAAASEDPSNPFTGILQGGNNEAYQRGFLTIGFICFLNASTNPLWHAAFADGGPPPLLMNAAISVTALAGLLLGAPLLKSGDEESVLSVEAASSVRQGSSSSIVPENVFGGVELGFWKFLGTSAHVCGLSLTTSNHGAFLIQLTTLIVPVIQGIQGEKIPRQIQAAVAIALAGVLAFTQDPSGQGATEKLAEQLLAGDLLCVAAALFYSLYDIQTFKWGKIVPRAELVTTKVATQAALSIALCGGLASTETAAYFSSNPDMGTSIIPVVLWSGLIVNALATFLQVGGMQAVGPTRAQLIFASQPLWSAGLAYAFLGETIGFQGALGGLAFLFALYLAATVPKDDGEPPAAEEAA